MLQDPLKVSLEVKECILHEAETKKIAWRSETLLSGPHPQARDRTSVVEVLQLLQLFLNSCNWVLITNGYTPRPECPVLFGSNPSRNLVVIVILIACD